MTSTRQRVHDRYWRHLRRHQRQAIDAILRNRYVAILGARQRGKTTGIGYCAGLLGQGVTWDGREVRPDHVQIISKTEKHSQDFTRRASRMLAAFDVGVSAARKRTDSLMNQSVGSMSRLELANGRQIFAHAGNPDTISGFSGSVIVDEISASRHDPEQIYQQAIAVASGREDRRVVLIGNSSVRGDWWHKFWHSDEKLPTGSGTWADRRRGFKMLTLDIWSEFPDRILPPDLRQVREAMGEAAWARWYECEFAHSLDRAVPDELIIRTGIGGERVPTHAPIVIGVDPGLNRNPTGVVVARVGGFGLDVLHAEYWRGPLDASAGASWVAAQLDQLDMLIQRHRPGRIVCDYSNFASGLGDALKARFGELVDLPATTTDSRQRRWGMLSSLLADGRLSIPPEAHELREDLARLEIDATYSGTRKMTEGGVLRLPQWPDGDHVLHCDLSDALMLCCDHVYADVGGSSVLSL